MGDHGAQINRTVLGLGLPAVCSALLFLCLPLGAQELNPDALIQRLEGGHWVAHVDVLDSDPLLLGFAFGFTETYEKYCPRYRDELGEAIFLGGLHWERFQNNGRPMSFTDAIGGILRSIAVEQLNWARGRRAGQSAAANYAGGTCGPSDGAHRLATNAARLAAGRRPAYGGPSEATFVDEEKSPISSKHMYKEGHLLYSDRASAALLNQHFKIASRTGARILTCLYDEDPTSETYTKQFYWGDGPAQVIDATSALRVLFIGKFQEQLEEASGKYAPQHPFTRYGPPRRDCPSTPDSALPMGKSSKPMGALPTPKRSSGPITPKVSMSGRHTKYDYGRVYNDFVPPVPDWRDPCCDFLTMKKEGVGYLTTVERTDGFWGVAGNRRSAVVEQDVERAHGMYGGERAYLLRCSYTTPRRNYEKHHSFWHGEKPDWATDAYFKSQEAEHPFLEIGEPIDFCPLTESEAARLKQSNQRSQGTPGAQVPHEAGSQVSGSAPPDRTEAQNEPISARPQHTPFTEQPELLNQGAVDAAIQKHFPPSLRAAGVEGTVSVQAFIDADGILQKAVLQRSSGYREFDEAALTVVELMRFRPARNGTERVPVWVPLEIKFPLR